MARRATDTEWFRSAFFAGPHACANKAPFIVKQHQESVHKAGFIRCQMAAAVAEALASQPGTLPNRWISVGTSSSDGPAMLSATAVPSSSLLSAHISLKGGAGAKKYYDMPDPCILKYTNTVHVELRAEVPVVGRLREDNSLALFEGQVRCHDANQDLAVPSQCTCILVRGTAKPTCTSEYAP